VDAAELELFRRSLSLAIERFSGEELDEALLDVGWAEALASDPHDAVAVLFALQGSANASTAALERVVLHALGYDAKALTGAVLPVVGRADAPGRRDGRRAAVRGSATRTPAPDACVLVVTRDGDAHVAAAAPADALEWSSVRGMDPQLGLVEVAGEVDLEDPVTVDWGDAVAQAQRALGHELVGASRRMLELAREHALERVQFDRPIAAFQAVRHRLAETLVASEAADAVLAAAWLDLSPQTAAMAKAVAARAARTAARHCQQVLAGIGFTTEHDLHLYIRRVLVLEQLFGGTRELTRDLGDDVLRSGQLPPLLPL
jgi:hypothetical protein